MKRVTSVTDLKAGISAILHHVKAGEEVLVTERGKPIARLVPYLPGPESSESFQRLVKEGAVRPGQGGSPWDFLQGRKRAKSQESVLSALLDERAEGR
ncbi:type II toxin-antitoxin system prevent-host-death family antitoxin [bacterium]|nr:type II toxin-antitoxin system prevent-host-death family antitoxin [bacterium]